MSENPKVAWNIWRPQKSNIQITKSCIPKTIFSSLAENLALHCWSMWEQVLSFSEETPVSGILMFITIWVRLSWIWRLFSVELDLFYISHLQKYAKWAHATSNSERSWAVTQVTLIDELVRCLLSVFSKYGQHILSEPTQHIFKWGLCRYILLYNVYFWWNATDPLQYILSSQWISYEVNLI